MTVLSKVLRSILAGSVLLTTGAAAAETSEEITFVKPDPIELPSTGIAHTVKPGQSLWTIARLHGCSVEALRGANRLEGNMLLRGQKLDIPRCDKEPPPIRVLPKPVKGKGVVHHVTSGESLFKIANYYDTTVPDILIRNELVSGMIYPGQQLRIVPGAGKDGKAYIGQSVGKPHAGMLMHGIQLTTGAGYYRRNPRRAWGANHAIFHLRRVVSTVSRRFPTLHPIAIGDISAKEGGNISGHSSHESGRDVDLGFYFNKRPPHYPADFVVGKPSNLHMGAMWSVLATLAATANSPSGVERVFLDYDVQGMIYRYGKKRGIPERTLRAVFQYPNGHDAHVGLVRHEPAHADHFHVRFKCPQGDRHCQ